MRIRTLLAAGAASLALASLGQAQRPLGPQTNVVARQSPLVPLESFSTLGMRFATDPALVSSSKP